MSISPSSLLYVFTSNFPFSAGGGEVMFVAPEMKRLSREGAKIVIVPMYPSGYYDYEDQSLELDLGLSQRLKKTKTILVLSFLTRLPFLKNCKFYLREILSGLTRWGIRGGAKALWWSCVANVAYEWALAKNDFGGERLFYTYWNTAVTAGLVLAVQSLKDTKVVTRVHGYDLYEERSVPPYLPFRPWLYKKIDRVFGISRAGVTYACDHGLDPNKVSLNYLGTEDPGELCRASSDGVLRVLSCSFVVPVKRVALMAQSILRLANKNPNSKIQWTHLGGGPLLDHVESILSVRPTNLEVHLVGLVTNKQVLDFYRNNNVDLILNLSESEGLPVSMMEALSFGVPVVATDVGGVKEVVDETNGVLLPADPTLDEVADALKSFVEFSWAEKLSMRKAARESWANRFNAELCHTNFRQSLFDLLKKTIS